MRRSQITDYEMVTCVNSVNDRAVFPAGTDAGRNGRSLEVAVAGSWPCSVLAAEHGQGHGQSVVGEVSSSPSGCQGAGQRTWCQAQTSDFLIPRKMSETPGEGIGPTETGIPVGRVPPPGEPASSNFRASPIPKREVRKSEAQVLTSGDFPTGHGHGVVRRVWPLSSRYHGAGQRTRGQVQVLTLVETPEYPEWVGTVISQGVGNEMVTCVNSANDRAFFPAGADAGRDGRSLEVAVAGSWLSSVPVAEHGQGHGQSVVGEVSSSPSGCQGAGQRTWCQVQVLTLVETPEYPEWVGTVISQGVGNEMVTCVKSANDRAVIPADADAGRDGRLLEVAVAGSWLSSVLAVEKGQGRGQSVVGGISSSPSGCRSGGGRTRCQAQVLTSGEIPEYPEWVGMAMSQGVGNEMVTCVKSANDRAVIPADADAGRDGRPLEVAVAGSWLSSVLAVEKGQGRGQSVVGGISSSPSGCRSGGGRTRCQAQVLTSGEIPEYPEWVGMAISQGVGNEMVTRVKNANDRAVFPDGTDAGRDGRSLGVAVAGSWPSSVPAAEPGQTVSKVLFDLAGRTDTLALWRRGS